MSRRTRKLALAIACLFAVVFLSCVVWMSVNINHHCGGEQCLICAQLDVVGRVMRRLCSVGAAVKCFLLITCCLAAMLASFGADTKRKITLVSLKVKLSD